MITKLFTFGYGQTCPFTGRKLDDHYATITAATEAECTALMVHLFGAGWAFPYATPRRRPASTGSASPSICG